jgi:hypothetical protein
MESQKRVLMWISFGMFLQIFSSLLNSVKMEHIHSPNQKIMPVLAYFATEFN